MSVISEHFKASAASILDNQHLEAQIEAAAKAIYASFEQGGKLLICGNGGSAADKQVSALGNANDCLMVITTSGNSNNIIKAVDVAHDKSVRVIALNGKDGGKLNSALNSHDINIVVKGDVTARIQEVHGLIIHCVCELIDSYILD